MTHLTDDQLLLLAWNEAGETQATMVESHLRGCDECRARLREIDESRLGMECGIAARRSARLRRAVVIGLQLAAAVVTVLLVRQVRQPAPVRHEPWQSHLVASPTAGYVTGGSSFMRIDSQLTRLEKGRIYGTLQD